MASNRKKQEEESNLKTLREIVGLPHNKHCFDCNQRGPTYVNMTIGSFVCTACSGLLRGLNPPHRVKSISMTSFSADEMELIKSRGNEYCRRVWLGLYDHKIPFDVDSKDESRMKELMSQRYEKKRWYVQASSNLAEECRRLNTTKPVVTTAASTINSKVTATIASSTNRPNSEPSHPFASPANKLTQFANQKQQQQPNNKASLSLFTDLNTDPFNKPQTQRNLESSGFADFSSFNAFPPENAFFPAQNHQQQQPFKAQPQLFSQPPKQIPFQQQQHYPLQTQLTQQQQQQQLQQQLQQQQQNQQLQQQQADSLAAQSFLNSNTSILLPNPSQPTQQNQQQQQQQLQQQFQQNSDKYSALVGLNDQSTTNSITTAPSDVSVVDWDGSKKSWMPAHAPRPSMPPLQSSLPHQPPPPSYNSLNFTNVPGQFGGLSISSSSTPHFPQPANYPPFQQHANGGVQSFGPFSGSNLQGGWNWMGAQSSTHNPFAAHQPPAPSGAPLLAPNNPNNPFL